MRTLILYTSKYGCTKDCANYLKNKLDQQTDIANLDHFQTADLQHYDWIILGGSIYIGKIQKSLRLFCIQNLPLLLTKKIALFICCSTPEQSNEFFKNNFPSELLGHAAQTVNFGGEIRPEKMTFWDKKITAMVSKMEPKNNEILYQNIEQLALLIH